MTKTFLRTAAALPLVLVLACQPVAQTPAAAPTVAPAAGAPTAPAGAAPTAAPAAASKPTTAPAAPAAAATRGQVVYAVVGTDVRVLNPILQSDTVSGAITDRLFEPLVTNKPLGMGLGLTTARALVVNQGGTLEAEGERGKGARFKLRLPLASGLLSQAPPPSRP